MDEDITGIQESSASENSKLWRERDAALIAFLRDNPATVEEILQTGAFASRATCARRIKTLRERGKIDVIGTEQTRGRPRDILFAGWSKPKRDQVVHELWVTRFIVWFKDAEIVRGKHVNKRYLADAEIYGEECLLYVELDTGSEGYRKAKSRMQEYKYCRDFVIWVALSERRMHGLRERAGVIAHCGLFTVLGSTVWYDYDGNVCSPDKLVVPFSPPGRAY